MTNEASFSSINVLLADSKPIESQLLAGALRHHGFQVSSCDSELAPVLQLADHSVMDVAVLSLGVLQSGESDMAILRTLHLSYPQMPKIVLMATEGRALAVQSFRLGARGLFCLADSSFPRLCECIRQVHRGEIWATTQQLNYLLDSVCQVPSLRVLTANGEKLLTAREEQVVALVADGLTNRNVATELGLSEHTVKKYLFRIFEKLGISNRVELVLYAVHHGSMQQTEWTAEAVAGG